MRMPMPQTRLPAIKSPTRLTIRNSPEGVSFQGCWLVGLPVDTISVVNSLPSLKTYISCFSLSTRIP